ncbi:ciliogenesis and planar polarity effector 1 isoform X1 [Malaclemys terrapin pileata]|uniref:ciliogenesis and planar polarity effector 1 isoform X1 n=2 Tax=Malaclemys terrapin pileata TaxID=2991368 RepID=UPI0023A85E46|nr:ciliogenesis and planar polarity effector 1 isoform X1 [Malaclemys terrapin pileata]
MEIKLDVLVSTCIKHRKPWPRISWLGQEKESIFLLDDKCISEINLLSGKTKKKIPRLQSLLKNVVVLATSRNGAWLAGIVTTGELFLWNKDQDYLKIVPAVEESSKVVTAAQECSMRLYLYVSGDGNKVLLITPTACIFLWESTECKNISSPKNPSLAGRWTQIVPEESILLPSSEDKETGMSADFIKNEILGDCCLCSFVFYSGERLMLTFLALRWHENSFKYISSLPYHIHWAQQACSLPTLVPVCVSVKSRGALLTAFSRDGLLLAVAINQNDPKATQILFINTLNFVTVSGSLKGCSSKNHVVPSKFVRSYWVGDMSWTLDSLFLACMLKRGSLILLTCMGELLTLVTSGCSIEFGPAEFIPFHPLITYRLQQSVSQDSSHSLGSSASESDLMRQRFSVTSHSRLPYLIVSDGYMVTVLRFSDNLLPSGVMRSLLLDSAQRLEKIHQSLMTPKSKGKRLQLRSLSSLKASLLKQHRNQNSTLSTIPKFLLLQEEETAELSEKAADLQDYEDKSDDDKQFQNNSSTFCSQGPNSFFSKADQGRLEFASMFDTVHAKDDTDAKDDLSTELNSIQKNLLAAWGIGISKNVQEKDMLLNYTIGCITHLFNILQFIKSPLLTHDAFLNKSEKYKLWMHAILKHFQQCLTVLYWDVRDRQTVGHLVKLTSQTVKLMLIQHQDQLFSEYLLGCFCLLKMVAHSLNGKFTPCYEIMSASSDVNSAVELDSLIVPIFQVLDGSSAQKFRSLNSLVKIPPQAVKLGEKPENRLMILWRLLYKQVLQYQTQLNRKISKDGKSLTEMKIAHEESIVAQLLGHIQAVLQSSGETLEQTRKLNSVIGEEQFLLGSYEESVDLWKRALQETKAKGEKRTQFLQTRYYLAILYCHLYHYNLTEAQGLSDHLVREILRRSQLSVRQIEDFSDAEYSQYELWMIRDVHPEAAMAVIQSMARFMAAYFTNQLLYILPPHKVDILPPLHINQDRFPRVVPLQHSVVTSAVRDQNLSSVWTAEYALDLLFVGGLIPEAVWLAHKLGDWKMSVSIGVAYNLYCQSGGDLRSEKTELHLPLNLTPTQIFQEKLQSFLGQPVSFETSNEERTKYKQFTDPIEEEDANVLFGSVQEILKAAVMADADILSETFQLLIDSAKDLTRKLCGLVPDGLYLPAPPLYCPQPASLSEKDYNDSPLKIERDYRQKVSGVLQRILLLFRAARCSCPVAQWYIVQLKWARKVMQKIRMKGTLPSLSSFPETLLHYSKFSTIFFRPASSGDHRFDDVSCKTIGCFRELCALCWMLHVRERLSDSCRHYQTARESMGNQKDCKKAEYDACIVEHCLNAVEWACRMLPFARFMNVEELVQDIILSLVGELPPIRKVAEILVKAFPNSEDVRVPLRDKYHALQQRLRHCIVRGSKSEEMMSVVIQATHKVRLKVLKRVIRNIGPIEMSIWEPSEEETPDDEAHCYDRFSLGTSLSRSTLSDCGNPQVYSDAETADTLSEALLTEETRNQAPSPQRETRPPAEEQTGSKKTAHKIKYLNWKAKHKEHSKVLPNQHTLPVVGAWEFERDDDEYVKFLDLFLSYMLERDFVNCSDPGIPFLTSFSELLREHELHSLLFDVHTTLKRRQGKTNSQNVFRAGCCYAVTLASCDSKPASLCNEKQKHLENQMSVSVLQPADSSVCDSVNGVKKYMGKEGLFGLNHLSVYRAQDKKQEITITPITQTLSDHACSNIQTSVTCKYVYKTIHVNDVLPREELALELKNKFSNIARLLEWMIRWSDRRLLCDTNKIEPFQESRPMIHVKTSAAAILTSLWLLGRPYCDESQARITSFKSPDYQYLMNSASLPETRPKIQKESSMDTGRSPATEMPHAVQDVNAYDELCENVLGIPTKTKHSEKNEMNESHSVTHSTEEGVIGFDEEVGAFLQEEVDATSENEELFEEPFGVPKSPSISVSIKPVQQQKEEHISTLDVESPWEEPMMEKLEEKKAKQNGMTEAVSGTIPHSFCLEMNADAPSVPYNGPVCSKKQVVQEGEQISEPLNVSEAVRQMLQDEMFKLVQLQQINFLNLMQMVGSSFASLPNMQHLLQQSQSIQLGGSQALHTVRGSGADTSLPIQSADISPETQLPTKENAGKSNKKSSSHSQERNILNDQSSKESIHNYPDVNISLSLSESQSNGTGFIPASQDLLRSAPAKPLHLLSRSLDIQKTPKLIPVAKTLNYENGFPLLKLESDHLKPLNLYPLKVSQAFIGSLPQPRVVWDPCNSLQNPPLSRMLGDKTISTTHLNLNKYDPEMIRQVYEEKKRWAEAESKRPPKLLNLDQYEGEQNLAPLQHLRTNVSAEKPLSAENASFYGTYPHSTGIPLLHLQFDPAPRFPPIIRPSVPASLIPVRPITEETNSRDTLQHTGISILHTNLPPKNKFQPPKLIPIQNLIAFEQSRQCTSAPHDFIGQDHSGQIELLKVNTEPFDARHTKNNTKRQKRRAEKQIKEKEDKKKPSVTFHPDDFIISTDDIERVFETEIQDQQAESSRYLEDDFVISLDTVGETITTTAGLHCMASTRKKPAETQDASTNTDPVLKSYQDIETGSEDKTVSELSKHQPIASVPSTEHLASRVPQMLPPDMYLNFKFHTEVGESLLPSSVSDTAPDLIGHKYINVIDIEDSDLFKDLPTIAESTEEMVTTQQHENFEVPSSAKLHHMAASVTNAIPPNEFQGKDDHQNGLFPVQERDVKSDAARDNLTWNLLHEDVSIIHSTGLSAKIISKEHFNTKLQEMDIQLQALQNIAENMEKDFSNTKLIVKTIEDLGMAASPNLGVASLFSEGVGVIDEARYVSSVDEEEEGSRPEYSVTSYTALQAHSLSPATSSANLLSRIKSSSDIHINEDLGDSFIDNPLQITGLSGITDVIDDLVTEGGISTTELGITKTQARSISRIHDTAAGQSPKTERERKEIQAWMKRKRKERLAEYLKKLDEQREREYNPFNLRNNMQFGLSAKEIKLSQKKKDEKDKALLSEHHNLRVSQALSLMNEMLSETVQLPASELRPLSKTMRFPRDFRKQQLTSARGRPGSRSLSASQAERSRTAAKPDFGQARSHSTPPQGLAQSGGTATVVLQKNISKGRIRNARHYPVNSRQVAIRPQDQTSQVTLRGMLTDFNRRRTRLQGNASQRQGLSKGRPNSARQASDYQTLSTRNLRRPTPCAAAIQREETGLDYESERDSISPWSVPDDIQRLLHDNYDSLLEVSVPHEEDCSPLSINDSVSESTGSILSKLDWNAVEAMVANVEEK